MLQITEPQRYIISTMRKQGYTLEEIGIAVHKNKSSISRELKRNTGEKGDYNPQEAHKKCESRHKTKRKHIVFTQSMEQRAKELLREDYSPEQVKGSCEDKGIQMVSHERLYQYVWEDKNNGGNLYVHLRRRGRKNNKRGSSKKSRGQIKNRVSIHQRPSIVNSKERFGDLEIDTIIGKGHTGAIVTINERTTGWLSAKLIPVKSAQWTEEVTITALRPLENHIHTITADNGKEFTNHNAIAKALSIDFYFADAYSSWQRGANENLNGLLRQYIPKKTNFTELTQKQIDGYVDKLNNRPRKRLGFKSPNFMMKQFIN
jgi:IS30 family transposase